MDVVASRTGSTEPDGVDHVQDLKREVDLVSLLNGLDQVTHLLLDLSLPSLAALRSDAGQALNVKPVLVGLVLHPVGELPVDGRLQGVIVLQLAVVMLEISDSIIVRANRLSNDFKLALRSGCGINEDRLGLVK